MQKVEHFPRFASSRHFPVIEKWDFSANLTDFLTFSMSSAFISLF